MKTFLLAILLLFAFSFGYIERALAQPGSESKVIVQGNPPLTESMVAKTIILLEWALDIKFSDEQKIEIIQDVINDWKTNNKEGMNTTIEIANLVDGLRKATAEDRNKAKDIIQADLLKGLRSATDNKISQMVLQVYEATHSGNSKTIPPPNSSSSTATKSKQRVGADGFTGIYWMMARKSININSTISESGYSIQVITFLPGGNVYRGLPPEGLFYFDPAVTQRAHPDDWGTYEIRNNGEIHISLGTNRNKYVLVRDGERLNNPPEVGIGKGVFRRIPATDGLKLEGNYRRDPSEPTITFTADGRFCDGGVFRYFGTLARPNGSVYQDNGVGGTGTYIIEQNTLELRYSDGRVKRFPFLAFPENLAKEPALDGFILRSEEIMKRY